MVVRPRDGSFEDLSTITPPWDKPGLRQYETCHKTRNDRSFVLRRESVAGFHFGCHPINHRQARQQGKLPHGRMAARHKCSSTQKRHKFSSTQKQDGQENDHRQADQVGGILGPREAAPTMCAH